MSQAVPFADIVGISGLPNRGIDIHCVLPWVLNVQVSSLTFYMDLVFVQDLTVKERSV